MLKLKNILGRVKNRINKRSGGQLDCLKGKAEEKRTVFDDVQMEEPSPYLVAPKEILKRKDVLGEYIFLCKG